VPVSRPTFTPGSRRVIAVLAAAAVAAGGGLVAIGLQPPDAEAVWAEAVPVAVARPAAAKATPSGGTAEPPRSYVGGVRLASYRASAGTALLATEDGAAAEVRPGDVIASPPSAAAPRGALFKVAKATTVSAGIEVETAPATLSDALGAADVDRTFQAKDVEMSVTPLAAGVRPAAQAPALPGAATGSGKTSAPPTPNAAKPGSAGTKPTTPSAAKPAPAGAKPTTPSAAKPAPAGANPTTPSAAKPAPAGANPTTPSSAKPTTPSGAKATPGAAQPTPSTANNARNTAKPTASAATPASSSAKPAPSNTAEATIPGVAIGGTTILAPARTADGGLLLTLDIPLAGVAGITGTARGGPKLSGWVGLTPELIFSYGGRRAEIGVGGKYTYGWQVHAALAGIADTGERALRLPFAEVHLSQTFWIGPVPVVLSVDLTYFYRLTAQGSLSIDTEQTTTGEFAVGAAYDSRTGWGPLNRNRATTSGDAQPIVTGRGDLRATVGADLAVFLYDAAGVTGRLAPYVRAAVDASLERLRWGVYAGFDLTATLTLQLKIFGITILKADLPVPPVHAEWKVAASDPEPAAPVSG
jgi:hypothetical protein